jgi:hypothetical protein
LIASLTTSRPFTVTRPLTRDLLIALGIGLGVAMAKLLFDFHLGIAGHAGVGWIAVLVAGSAFGRPGVGAAAGLSVGLWGVPVGLGHSMGYNALLYASAGAALDLVRIVRPLRLSNPLSNPIAAATAGLAVHMTKLGFVVVYAGSIGMVKHIHLTGLAPVALNHAIFGVAGGLLGWAAIRTARRGRGLRTPK